MARAADKHHRILVVDDENSIREIYRVNLESAGFVCFTASSGQTALEVFAAEIIDLAIVDILMPKMSGLDLFATVQERYPHTAVLFVTAVDQMDVAVSQIKGGALDYLVKPVKKDDLIEAVNEALDKQSEHIGDADDQQHLEELSMYQSKALENKVREARALNRMFDEFPDTSAAA